MSHDNSQRTTFDEVAEWYDEVRPGYPELLVEAVLALSAIPPGGRILEIGCGTGQATLPFARRGYSLLCLELGSRMAALAAEKCRPYPGVEIQNVAFEDWPLPGRAFDLVISASAFHWISPEIRYAKAAASLRAGGSLALFWHHAAGEDTPFRRALTQVYRERAPHLVEHLPGETPTATIVERTLQDFESSGRFGPVIVREYPWTETHTAEQHIKLLNTYSSIRSLDPGTRRDLLTAVREVVERFGGQVSTSGVVLLYLARVRG
jgi:SAM-dependent methyltransferase